MTVENEQRFRFAAAYQISAGATNPVSVSALLAAEIRHMARSGDSTAAILQDPALRVIVHQLAFMFKVHDEMLAGDTSWYGPTLQSCQEANTAGWMSAI